MPAGRKPIHGKRTKTSLDLSKEEELALMRLQVRRLECDRPATKRDLIIEGITLLLEAEGLDPMSKPATPSNVPVVEIPKRGSS